MQDTKILSLLEELSVLLEDSKPTLTKQNIRQVDVDQAFDILDEIREVFPTEFAEASAVAKQKNKILTGATMEAERLVADAKRQVEAIASEQNIVKTAQAQAQKILEDAKELERQTRVAANAYADGVFAHVDETLAVMQQANAEARSSAKFNMR